jgi:hypothetical protein
VAPLHWLSLILCVMRYPSFISSHNIVQKVVTLILVAREDACGLPLTSLTDASRADFLIISLLPWRWRRYVPPKRRLTPYPDGATSQKTAFFIYQTVCHWKCDTLFWE